MLTTKGTVINDPIVQYGFPQIMHEPTHFLGRSSSCTDLIFTSEDNLVTNFGVHSS